MSKHSSCFSIVILLGAWLAGGVGVLAAEEDLSQWSHRINVEVATLPGKGLLELALTPEVLNTARADLADLRLRGPGGEVVPYVVRLDRGTTEQPVAYSPIRLYNATFESHKQSSITVDFGSRAARTRVDVDTPGTNFRRRVTVEASADGETWQTLVKTAWLFRIGYDTDYHKGTYNKSEISLPDNDFRYLRVTVFNAPDDPEQVVIREVKAWRDKRTVPAMVEVPTHAVTVTPQLKIKATEIEIDLGYVNLPLAELTLDFADAAFVRRVEVLGRDRSTRIVEEPVENATPRRREIEEPWTMLRVDSIHRLPGMDGQETSTNLHLPLTGTYRYLLLRIYDGDDAPLKFNGVTVRRLQQHLNFAATKAGVYQLYLGNAKAVPPRYDLTLYAERLRAQGVSTLTLGQLTPNPQYAAVVKTLPWSERYAGLLWVALLAVAAVLGGLVWRQARQASTPQVPK